MSIGYPPRGGHTFGHRMLENVLPRTVAALFATSIYTAGATLLAVAGVEELRRALPVVPEATVEGLRADARGAGTADSPDQPGQ